MTTTKTGLTELERRVLDAMVQNADDETGGDFGILDSVDYRSLKLTAQQFGALVTNLQAKKLVYVWGEVRVNGGDRLTQFTIEVQP